MQIGISNLTHTLRALTLKSEQEKEKHTGFSLACWPYFLVQSAEWIPPEATHSVSWAPPKNLFWAFLAHWEIATHFVVVPALHYDSIRKWHSLVIPVFPKVSNTKVTETCDVAVRITNGTSPAIGPALYRPPTRKTRLRHIGHCSRSVMVKSAVSPHCNAVQGVLGTAANSALPCSGIVKHCALTCSGTFDTAEHCKRIISIEKSGKVSLLIVCFS